MMIFLDTESPPAWTERIVSPVKAQALRMMM
jgi:hypothetical protein